MLWKKLNKINKEWWGVSVVLRMVRKGFLWHFSRIWKRWRKLATLNYGECSAKRGQFSMQIDLYIFKEVPIKILVIMVRNWNLFYEYDRIKVYRSQVNLEREIKAGIPAQLVELALPQSLYTQNIVLLALKGRNRPME